MHPDQELQDGNLFIPMFQLFEDFLAYLQPRQWLTEQHKKQQWLNRVTVAWAEKRYLHPLNHLPWVPLVIPQCFHLTDLFQRHRFATRDHVLRALARR